MEQLFKVTIIGLVSGILGTSIGGLMAFFVRDITNRLLSLILEFSAGLMTAVVCFEMLPEAFQMGGLPVSFTGVFIGIFIIIIIENHMISRNKRTSKSRRKSGILKTGILMAIGIAMHNLPEGFAVGSGFEASTTLGVTLTAIIIIHDIPEGISIAVPLRAGGFSAKKAFTLTLLSGLPMGIGALAGSFLGGLSQKMISGCLGFAAGAMLYVVFAEIIPQSKRLYQGRLASVGNIAGILAGIFVTMIGK